MGQFTSTSHEQWQATECQGKQRFDDAARAHDVAAKSRRRRAHHASAYKCRFCGGWHIGSSAQPKVLREQLNSKRRK